MLLLIFLGMGAVVADWFMSGRSTVGHGSDLLLYGGGAAALYGLGFWTAKRNRTFLGFSHAQWATLPIVAFTVGLALRKWML
jgi:hypothetical protein